MKTDSIKDILEMTYGYKENYNKKELDSIDNITINRFNIVNDINNIDFTELLLFKNLDSLTLNECIIDHFIMSIILKLEELDNLVLNNCEFIDNPEYFFINLKLKSLIIENTKFDLNLLQNNYYEYIHLSNIIIEYPIYFNAKELDIKNSNIKDYSFLDSNIDTLIISETQYQNDIFNKYSKHLIIMESNGQMIKKEVNK